ncbi:tellurium resistance protein [Paracoccus sp. S-4012]|uniref:SLAC1 family transporter n=1 Tax=Paracoccus sp. S-4012 TaxID=2665648 RepID=UPI0018A1B78F|nr:tellurium resistance protein [Paracoccus sp. S-4012]
MARLRFAPLKPAPRGLWRRVPPAIFPVVLGLGGLALVWEEASRLLGLPPGPAGLPSGAVAGLALFAWVAYAGKLLRRPAVLLEDLAILPGRAGLAAAALSFYPLAGVTGLYSAAAGRGLLVLGLALHLVLVAALIRVLRTGPEEQRRVSPVWHLSFAGFIVAGPAALILGWPGLAAALFWPMLLMAAAIYAVSMRQVLRARVPAPLRPMLAIHLAPLALFGTVAAGLGWEAAAWAFGLAALALLIAGVVGVRWLLAAGFSPLWGVTVFPLAATAGQWVALLGLGGGAADQLVAAVLLVATTLVVVPLAFRILRLWHQGRLPVITNAAIA